MRKILYFLLISHCMVFVSCSFSEQKDEQDYKTYYDNGGRLVVNGSFGEAEQSYLSALKIAQKNKWTGKTVGAKQRLAEVYLSTNNYDKTKEQLLEAKNICISNVDCSAGLLGSLYDYLIHFSLLKENNISLSLLYIDEVISLRKRLAEDEGIKNKLNRYAGDMKAYGFEKEANDLIKRANEYND